LSTGFDDITSLLG